VSTPDKLEEREQIGSPRSPFSPPTSPHNQSNGGFDHDRTPLLDKTTTDITSPLIFGMTKMRFAGFIGGPLCFIIFSSFTLSTKHPDSGRMLGSTLWMSIWWLTEVAPLGVTALLPSILFPLLSFGTINEVIKSYFNNITFLIIGALVVNISIEHVKLHTRFALWILLHTKPSPRGMLFGFMLSGWMISGTCFNTSTTLMMIPLVTGIIQSAQKRTRDPAALNALDRFFKASLCGIAWSVTIGGTSTLIGTGINAICAGVYADEFPQAETKINFANWFLFAYPMSFSLLFPAWFILGQWFLPSGKKALEPPEFWSLPPLPPQPSSLLSPSSLSSLDLSKSASDFPLASSTSTASTSSEGGGWSFDRSVLLAEREQLGPMNRDEKVVAGVQLLLMLGWILRPLAVEPYVGNCKDGVSDNMYDCPPGEWDSVLAGYDCGLACMAATSLFLIPSALTPGQPIVTWEVINKKFPWDLLFVFGGGFALAEGFKKSELSLVIADSLQGLSSLPLFVIVLLICVLVSYLTEVTTALALGTIFLPIMAAVGRGLGLHPLLLMLSSTVSCSLAFMLPIATPPNLLVYASGYIRFWTMSKPGCLMNLAAAIVAAFWLFLTAGAVYSAGAFQWTTPTWLNQTTSD
jgi:sodium-dependent dicarboxylate transporter 2/3/5